jgi:RNA polymerase sigma-70 factor (sigma-E family)
MDDSLVAVDRRKAFEDVVRDNGLSLTQLAYLLCRDRSRAEDLTAEAFARTWERWRDGGVEDLLPYLRRVIVNLASRTRYRRFLAERSERAFDALWSMSHPEPDPARVDLVRSVLRLPLPQRAVILLRYFEDRSEAEIASTLGISIGTVKSRSSRALATLQRTYGETFDA